MVPAVRAGPVIGLAAQLGVLAMLTEMVGLGVGGWLAGVGYGIVTYAALASALGNDPLGPADRVTLSRATLVGGVAALTVESVSRPAPVAALVALASVALALDAVDGKVARRTGTVSALGARFDMEVDAFLLLVLSWYAARSVGGWVLAIGAMRYAFVAAGWILPWMRGPLPPRLWRKVVAATQGVVLVIVAAGVLPGRLPSLALAGSLALLVESFGRDVGWLWRRPSRSGRRLEGGTVRGGPLRRGRHADPAVRERGAAAAPRGGVPRPRPAGPRGGRARVAAGARPE
jgi:phosphatidylglycerophosphate synthase